MWYSSDPQYEYGRLVSVNNGAAYAQIYANAVEQLYLNTCFNNSLTSSFKYTSSQAYFVPSTNDRALQMSGKTANITVWNYKF